MHIICIYPALVLFEQENCIDWIHFYTPVSRRAVLCDSVWRAGVHTGFRTITLVLYIGSLPNLVTWFHCRRGRTLFILGSLGQRSSPFHRGNMWPSLLKIQYTELKLSCGNYPVVKNSIYSNGDLDLWPNDPKINRVLPLPQGNHVVRFGKDPIYRTKVIMWKRPCCQKFYLK
jgi:hypothetical protein